MLRQCAVCGAKFTPRNNRQKYCSNRCARTADEHAMSISAPVSNEHIMRAIRKPANTSEVRWRMELRRRANPELYAMAVEA